MDVIDIVYEQRPRELVGGKLSADCEQVIFLHRAP